MKIETKYFGQVEINNDDQIRFEHGIPGFSDEREFIFLPMEDTEFLIMQSLQTPQLAFVTSSPFTFFKDYQIKLQDSVIEQLKIQNEEEVVVLVLLSVQNPFAKSTANLVAPIVFNTTEKLGKQVILEHTSYKTKHYIVDQEVEQKEGI